MKLTEEQIDERLRQEGLSGWKMEDHKWIVRKYRFSAFLDGIRFVNEIARIAEANNHHPMIAIDYKMVTLRLTSWHAGGLTELDFSSAEQYEQAFIELKA